MDENVSILLSVLIRQNLLVMSKCQPFFFLVLNRIVAFIQCQKDRARRGKIFFSFFFFNGVCSNVCKLSGNVN